MKIIYEDNHLLVVDKPVNIPVQADDSRDEDLLTLLKNYLKEKYQKPGNVYLGLVHRLDRPVGGVMVFAKTSKAASRLSEQVRTNRLHKEYLAVVQGVPEMKKGRMEDWLTKDHKTNTTTLSDAAHGKKATLDYEVLASKDGLSLLRIDLETGRSHQIRVQCSSRRLPLWGDQRYNPSAHKGQQIALHACRLSFTHPTTGETVSFDSRMPESYPWNLFNKEFDR